MTSSSRDSEFSASQSSFRASQESKMRLKQNEETAWALVLCYTKNKKHGPPRASPRAKALMKGTSGTGGSPTTKSKRRVSAMAKAGGVGWGTCFFCFFWLLFGCFALFLLVFPKVRFVGKIMLLSIMCVRWNIFCLFSILGLGYWLGLVGS